MTDIKEIAKEIYENIDIDRVKELSQNIREVCVNYIRTFETEIDGKKGIPPLGFIMAGYGLMYGVVDLTNFIAKIGEPELANTIKKTIVRTLGEVDEQEPN